MSYKTPGRPVRDLPPPSHRPVPPGGGHHNPDSPKRYSMDPSAVGNPGLTAFDPKNAPPSRSPPPTPPPQRNKKPAPSNLPSGGSVNAGRPLPRPGGGTNGSTEKPKAGTSIGGTAPLKPVPRPARPSPPTFDAGPKPARRRSLDSELKYNPQPTPTWGSSHQGSDTNGSGASHVSIANLSSIQAALANRPAQSSFDNGSGSKDDSDAFRGARDSVKNLFSTTKKAIGDAAGARKKNKEKQPNGSNGGGNGEKGLFHSAESVPLQSPPNGHHSLPSFPGGSKVTGGGGPPAGLTPIPVGNLNPYTSSPGTPQSARERNSGRIAPLRPPGRPGVSAPASPSPPSGRKETPFERRTKIANEILETEETYVQALQTLMEVYERELYAVCDRTPAVTKNGVRSIFSTLPQIIGVNEEMLRRLRDCMARWDERKTIGDVFVTMVPFLKIYKDYENDYNNALEAYTQYLRDPEFAAAVERCDNDPRVALRLEGCLITPIQRIPRYKLLLEDLVKHTPNEHPDSPLLRQALAKMEEVAMYIDDYLKENEQRMRMLEITSKSGASELLAPHRKLIREDEVKVKADSNQSGRGKKMQLLLFNDIVVPCPQSKLVQLGLDTGQAMLNKRSLHWPLGLVWIKEDDPTFDGQTIELTGPGRVYIVRFANAEAKSSWLREFKEAVEKVAPGAKGDKREGEAYFRSSLSYSGQWLRGKTHGEGTFTIYGTTYTGRVDHDVKTGYGTMVYASREVYEGEWREDLPHGQGKMKYPGGHSFDGAWKCGRRSGRGVMKYANGDVYDGFWEDNYPSGHGVLTCTSGVKYDGNWADGLFHGLGNLVLPNGKEYNGNWVAGQRDGQGNYRHYHPSNRNIIIEEYTGAWLADQRHGVGTLTNTEGTYQGMFEYGKKEGQGCMRYVGGSTYDGLWKQNMRHGIGTLICNEHGCRIKRYEGEWKLDKKDGKGVADLYDGTKYEGSFKADLFHGVGVMTSSDGKRKVECKWEKGLRVGPAKVVFKGAGSEGADKELNGVVREPVITTKKCTYPLAPPLLLLQSDSFNL